MVAILNKMSFFMKENAFCIFCEIFESTSTSFASDSAVANSSEVYSLRRDVLFAIEAEALRPQTCVLKPDRLQNIAAVMDGAVAAANRGS